MPVPSVVSELPSGHESVPINYRSLVIIETLVEGGNDIFISTSRGWVSLQGGVGGAESGSMKWKGAWINTEEYIEGDVVSYDGDLYIAEGDMLSTTVPGVPSEPPILNLPHQRNGNITTVGHRWLGTVDKSYTAGSDYTGVNASFYFDVVTPGTLTVDKTSTAGTGSMGLCRPDGTQFGGASTSDLVDQDLTIAGRWVLVVKYQASAGETGTVKLVPGTVVLGPPTGIPVQWQKMITGV